MLFCGKVFDEILNGTAKQPNLIHIVKIAEFLGVEVNNFINVVLKNQSLENISAIDSARKATFIVKNFDVKALTKLGFFNSEFSTEELVKKVLDYFGYTTINEFEEQLDEPLYSKVKKNHSDKMKDFWIKSAYQTFKVINNPNEYNRERLKELIVKAEKKIHKSIHYIHYSEIDFKLAHITEPGITPLLLWSK